MSLIEQTAHTPEIAVQECKARQRVKLFGSTGLFFVTCFHRTTCYLLSLNFFNRESHPSVKQAFVTTEDPLRR